MFQHRHYVAIAADNDKLLCAALRMPEEQYDLLLTQHKAARAMLAALKKINNNWDNLHPKDRHQARAAIAQAEAAGIKAEG